MIKKILAITLIFICHSALSKTLTVEEQRIDKVKEAYPKLLDVFATDVSKFQRKWKQTSNYQEAKELVNIYSNNLWLNAKKEILSSQNMDDRPLYWTRLLSSKVMRTEQPQFKIEQAQLTALLELLEKGSRGQTDLEYTKGAMKKILLTGFDPFLLDRNINQSNPSGVTALMLDGKVIEYKGITAEINTVMIPVIYKDFDDGIIESLLAPYYALNNVDIIFTVSMGRKEFDLERFPGKRRSVTAPDNLNVLSGGTKKQPIISQLHNRKLPGNEFVEFSLPVGQMKLAKGPYKVIDNHKVTTLKKGAYSPATIEELNGEVAVNGSGGGYLSNEISYRSIRLRNELNSSIPTGHIHTPRIQQFEPEVEGKIVEQINAMLKQSLVAL
mgnify:FL=1